MLSTASIPLLLFVVSTSQGAQPATPKAPDFMAPLAFLAGHCWEGEVAPGQRDIQCYDWLYDRQFLRSEHSVIDSNPHYQGITMYSWDALKKRLRFHYFVNNGAVSEGHLIAEADGFRIPETHLDSAGNKIELETAFSHIDEFHYSAHTKMLVDGTWQPLHMVEYRRMDGAEMELPNAALSVAGRQYQLAWNALIDERWVIVIQDRQGRAQPIGGVEADEWIWNRAGDVALILSKQRSDAELAGWRMAVLHLSGNRQLQGHRERIDANPVRDSSFSCVPGLALCAMTEVEAEHSSIQLLRVDQSVAESNPGRELFGDGRSDAEAEFSPDAKRILFRSRRSGSWELWEANLDGSDPRQLTADPANDGIAAHHYGGEGPARYSPDGQRIVWTRRFADRGFDIWQMDRDGSNARNLSADHAGDDSYPTYSPDGRQIAFSSARDGNDEIYVMNSDGSAVRRISFQPGNDLAPLWLMMPEE